MTWNTEAVYGSSFPAPPHLTGDQVQFLPSPHHFYFVSVASSSSLLLQLHFGIRVILFSFSWAMKLGVSSLTIFPSLNYLLWNAEPYMEAVYTKFIGIYGMIFRTLFCHHHITLHIFFLGLVFFTVFNFILCHCTQNKLFAVPPNFFLSVHLDSCWNALSHFAFFKYQLRIILFWKLFMTSNSCNLNKTNKLSHINNYDSYLLIFVPSEA